MENMEKELDDVAEGKVKKIKIIKDFYAYLEKQIANIKQIDNKLTDGVILGKTNSGIDIVLKNGRYGKYLVCGDKNLNLKYLIPKDSTITESNIESKAKANAKEIIELVEKKLSEPEPDKSDEKKVQIEPAKIYKEWVKGKTKYNLKSGQYGYYLEEIGGTGKKSNWSMGFMIKKIARDNLIDDIDENINEITDKITMQDIQSNIEYLKNMKKNKFVKK